MLTELERLHKKVFDENFIKIKANPLAMNAIKRNCDIITLEEDPIDGYVGQDWQGNTMSIEDTSTPIIEALFNNMPLNYGDEEDFEYSLTSLQPYTVTVDMAIEIFYAAETLVISGQDSMNALYDTTRKYLSMLRDYNALEIHQYDDLNEDYEKMESLLEWLKPIVRNQGGGFKTDSPLARLFSAGFRKLGAIDVESDDILVTKRKEIYEEVLSPHGAVTMDSILGR
ncbi:hypothetical protein CZP2022_161 [Vibrio phage C-ZP2022]|nr:hypothetical protein CZP2022_161 [Vibrio phage C-ZP2022]